VPIIKRLSLGCGERAYFGSQGERVLGKTGLSFIHWLWGYMDRKTLAPVCRHLHETYGSPKCEVLEKSVSLGVADEEGVLCLDRSSLWRNRVFHGKIF